MNSPSSNRRNNSSSGYFQQNMNSQKANINSNKYIRYDDTKSNKFISISYDNSDNFKTEGEKLNSTSSLFNPNYCLNTNINNFKSNNNLIIINNDNNNNNQIQKINYVKSFSYAESSNNYARTISKSTILPTTNSILYNNYNSSSLNFDQTNNISHLYNNNNCSKNDIPPINSISRYNNPNIYSKSPVTFSINSNSAFTPLTSNNPPTVIKPIPLKKKVYFNSFSNPVINSSNHISLAFQNKKRNSPFSPFIYNNIEKTNKFPKDLKSIISSTNKPDTQVIINKKKEINKPNKLNLLKIIKSQFIKELFSYISREYKSYCINDSELSNFFSPIINRRLVSKNERKSFLDQELYKMFRSKKKTKECLISLISLNNKIYENLKKDKIYIFMNLLNMPIRYYYRLYIGGSLSDFSLINTIEKLKNESEIYRSEYIRIAKNEFIC